jgi:hypothetical protein
MMLWKQDLISSSGEGKELPTVLAPLEGSNLNYWSSFGKLRHSDKACEMIIGNIKISAKETLGYYEQKHK